MYVRCCEFDTCKERRVHHERPDEPRGIRYVEVPDSTPGPWFCSFTCAMMAQYMSVKRDDGTVGMAAFEAKYPDWKTRWKREV